jgi:hypothetical protein
VDDEPGAVLVASIRQPSFQGGVLSPTMHGRTDLEAYSKGLKTCTNFFISKHGAAVSRPGMLHCEVVPDGDRYARIVPFIYSDQTSFVLVFSSDGNIYFIKDGAFVQSGGSDYAVPYNLSYLVLDSLRWVQVGDVMFFAFDGTVAPRTLTRVADDNWSWAPMDFSLPNPSFQNEPALVMPPAGSATDGHPERDWKYRVTETVTTFSTNSAVESRAYNITEHVPAGDYSASRPRTTLDGVGVDGVGKFPVYPDGHNVLVSWGSDTGSALAAGHAYRVYRGRGGIFGFIGESTDRWYFTDVGDEPDYAIPPPQGRNPFFTYATDTGGANGYDYEDSTGTSYPSVVGLFEQRMVFGGQSATPNKIHFSVTNNYTNFDQPYIPTADSAIEVDFAARRRERVRAIVGLDKLIVLTDAAVWAVGGGGGAPIAPTDLIEARVQSDIGSAAIDPLVIDNSILYVRAKGTGVRDLGFSNERGSFAGGDLSFFANHLFHGFSITRWCYQEDPHGVVWAVRSDGKLLSLTYVKDLGVYAWALHETNGTVYDIVSVPETEEDTVYLMVGRTVGTTELFRIEKFSRRNGTVINSALRENDIICLDGSYTDTGAINTNQPLGVNRMTSAVLTGLIGLTGLEVWAVADGAVLGPYTVVGDSITLSVGGIALSGTDLPYVVHVGLRYDCDLELLDLAESRDRQKTVKKVGFDVESSRGGWAGEDFDNLKEWQQRQVGDNFDPLALTSTTAEVRIGSTWNKHGRACIRQVDPLPLTVLGVEREVVGGG